MPFSFRLPWSLATGSVLLVAGTTLAEPRAPFRVERGPGAESCPDTPQLSHEIELLRGHREAGEASYDVHFERTSTAYVARIVSATDRGERKLTDDGKNCDALGKATAVTLALLLDAEPRPAAEAEPARAARPVPPPAPPESASGPSVESPRRAARAFTIHAGGALLAGVVRPVAAGVVAGFGLRTPELQLGLGGVWIVPSSIALSPGQVRASMLAAKLDACLAVARPAFARVDVCSGLLAGFVHAEAHGYTRDDEASRPWLGVPLELALRSETVPFGWDAGLALVVPVRRQDFQVDGAGVAYRSLPVSGFVWLRAVGAVPW